MSYCCHIAVPSDCSPAGGCLQGCCVGGGDGGDLSKPPCDIPVCRAGKKEMGSGMNVVCSPLIIHENTVLSDNYFLLAIGPWSPHHLSEGCCDL